MPDLVTGFRGQVPSAGFTESKGDIPYAVLHEESGSPTDYHYPRQMVQRTSAFGGWTTPALTNITRIGAADDLGAGFSTQNSPSAKSPALVGYDFGFGIPAGAIIDGFEMETADRGMNADPNFNGISQFWQLTKNAGATLNSGLDKFSRGTAQGAFNPGTAGGAADKWSLTWTRAEVRQLNFGISIQYQRSQGSADSENDYVRLRVYYH